MFKQIAIIGIGLIGGSLGLAIKQAREDIFIIGYDIDADTLDKAVELGAIDVGKGSIEDAVKDAQVIFLCSPLGEIINQISIVVKYASYGAVITDVGSVKKPVIEKAREIIGKARDIYFIGGHPMAGSEKKGIKAADPFLFENAIYVICPDEKIPDDLFKKFISLIKLTGAHILLIDPDTHDRVAAYISHLPQILAVALVNTAGERGDLYLNLAAGGFKDLTRIASSQFRMWEDIILLNSRDIVEALDYFIEKLKFYRELLDKSDISAMRIEFDTAFRIRNEIPYSKKGFIHALYDVYILVEDRPGVISKFSTVLFENGLNIRDIELLRVREGSGGTFRLSFESEKDAQMAINVLKGAGFKVFTR